jgi:hypothetical protein
MTDLFCGFSPKKRYMCGVHLMMMRLVMASLIEFLRIKAHQQPMQLFFPS